MIMVVVVVVCLWKEQIRGLALSVGVQFGRGHPTQAVMKLVSQLPVALHELDPREEDDGEDGRPEHLCVGQLLELDRPDRCKWCLGASPPPQDNQILSTHLVDEDLDGHGLRVLLGEALVEEAVEVVADGAVDRQTEGGQAEGFEWGQLS